MKITKLFFKKLASIVAGTAMVAVLATPANMPVAFAAEDSNESIELEAIYNEGLFDSYEEAVAATKEIDAENIAADKKEGYLNDAGEVVDIPKYTNATQATDFIRKCMVERRSSIQFQLKSSATNKSAASKELNNLINGAFNETPNSYEGDYLKWHFAGYSGRVYHLRKRTSNGYAFTGYNEYRINMKYLSSQYREAKVTKQIENLMKTSFKDWNKHTDYYNTLQAYNWICDKFAYDYSATNEDHSAAGGFLYGKTVCQGYATGMYRLLKEMAVPVRIVASKVHGWNIVKIGGKYYNVDATWGDTINNKNNKNDAAFRKSFFLRTDKNITFMDKGENVGSHTRYNINGWDCSSSSYYKNHPMATADYVAPSNYKNTISTPNVGIEYKTQIQTYGWENTYRKNGATSGTQGKAKRLETIKIRLTNKGNLDLGIEYKTHIQSYGWETKWARNDQQSGTVRQSKRLEAIMIRLYGSDAAMYDVYYRVHAQTYGWLGWAKNGECAGTAGQSKRLEGIQIKIVKKGAGAPAGTQGYSYIDYGKTSQENDAFSGMINYKTHVQTYGWQNYVSDGSLSGTYGESKRLEAIRIYLGELGVSGSVQYRTYVQKYGWMPWKNEGSLSGTSNESKRLEAIEIRLTGDVSKQYDVYYRVHAQTYGWLGWAKNGQTAGTAKLSKRLEGIQIVLVKKNAGPPTVSTAKSFIQGR